MWGMDATYMNPPMVFSGEPEKNIWNARTGLIILPLFQCMSEGVLLSPKLISEKVCDVLIARKIIRAGE